MIFNIHQCFKIFTITALSLLLIVGSLEAQNTKSEFKEKKRVEYLVGNLPIIISAPHGGRILPKDIPDRTYGVLLTDTNTDLLAKDIYQAFINLTGKAPHVIICHLKRLKVDCNREIKEAAQKNPDAEKVWKAFHGFIGKAVSSVIVSNKQGLYIDLHGQSHPEARLELGYLISNNKLQGSNSSLINLQNRSSLKNLLPSSQTPFLELLKGKSSMGGLMNKYKFPSVPSPAIPHSDKAKYFSGGYNTRRYCLLTKENIYGFQAECPRKGVRDTDGNRKKFAKAFAKSIIQFLKIHAKLNIKIKNP
ncbi:MAG: hypothetical protein COA79_25180 [Planctomycetota bacterium]|nr:MAG: hypothetical protein COA79_25180 [Planctomycetota bacterium]